MVNNMNRVFLVVFIVSILLPFKAFCSTVDSIKRLDPIIVMGESSSREYLLAEGPVFVLDKNNIETKPVNSAPDLLKYSIGVDALRRNANGVQSDIGIRGADFEKTLILIDGVRYNDPQTGHHNMDLPVSLDDIDSIEIYKGPSSGYLGPYAFGGAINIITKKKLPGAGYLKQTIGERGFKDTMISLGPRVDELIFSRASFRHSASDGHIEDTEFTENNVNMSALIDKGGLPISAFFGYTAKDFGADSFYSNLFPHEEEHTAATFFNAQADADLGPFSVEPKIYYKRHFDKYYLDRRRPSFYTNYHTTYIYGQEVSFIIPHDMGKTEIKEETSLENITSTQLGRHSRQRAAICTNNQLTLTENAVFDGFCRFDYYSDFHSVVSPGASLTYKFNSFLKIQGSLSRVFRPPSFTELYYNSPSNIGDKNLDPEKAWSYELDAEIKNRCCRLLTSAFLRRSDTLIDWVRYTPSSAWLAKNVTNVDTYGVENTLHISPNKIWKTSLLTDLILAYSFTRSEKDADYISKYAFNHLEHQFIAGAVCRLPFAVTWSLDLTYNERARGGGFTVFDSRIQKTVDMRSYSLEIFLDGSNIFDRSYEDIAGVKLPGRWVRAGASLRF